MRKVEAGSCNCEEMKIKIYRGRMSVQNSAIWPLFMLHMKMITIIIHIIHYYKTLILVQRFIIKRILFLVFCVT